jgi:hypothetical protein
MVLRSFLTKLQSLFGTGAKPMTTDAERSNKDPPNVSALRQAEIDQRAQRLATDIRSYIASNSFGDVTVSDPDQGCVTIVVKSGGYLQITVLERESYRVGADRVTEDAMLGRVIKFLRFSVEPSPE